MFSDILHRYFIMPVIDVNVQVKYVSVFYEALRMNTYGWLLFPEFRKRI